MANNNTSAVSRPSLQRAFDVSLNRWARSFQSIKQVKLTKSLAQRKLQDVATRFKIGLGLQARDTNYPQESNLVGPSLAPLAYSLTVCWGQFYVMIWVFATWLLGSLIIFTVFKLLGSSHSAMEVTSTLGYAMAPLALLEPLITLVEEPLPGLGLVVKLLTVLWASRTASLALIQPVTEKKIFLFACPLVLFNIFLISFRSGA